jgi:hypothetical protein
MIDKVAAVTPKRSREEGLRRQKLKPIWTKLVERVWKD